MVKTASHPGKHPEILDNFADKAQVHQYARAKMLDKEWRSNLHDHATHLFGRFEQPNIHWTAHSELSKCHSLGSALGYSNWRLE